MSIFDRVKTEEEQRDPWAPTLDPLLQHKNMLNNQAPWTSYQGDWVSDMNGTQTDALDNITNYGNRQAQWHGQRMQNTGREMMDNGQNAQNYFNNALNWGAIQNNGPDMEMVAKLADNPYMNGMIDSVGRDVSRNLYENQMPGIAASSAGAGQTGSSRRGAAEAIAARGAADRLADTSAALRGGAYDRALGLGADIASQNAGLRFDNRGQGLDAANQIRGMAQEGVGMVQSGGDMRRQGYSDALMAGDRLQAQDQAEVDALMAQHMLDQELPYDQAQAGFNALMDPAVEFGERNNELVEEWDGAPDILTAILTGGGNGGGGGGGGGNGGLLDTILGGLGGVGDWIGDNVGDGPGGSTTGVLDQVGGWLGDLIGIGGGGSEQQNESVVRENQAAVEAAGYPAGSPGFMNIMRAVIGGASIAEAINRERAAVYRTEGGYDPDGVYNPQLGDNGDPGGTPVPEGNTNTGGDDTSQAIADLIAQGMTMDQALESLGLSSPDTGSVVDTEIPGGTSTRLPEGTTNSEPVTGNPDDPSLSDLEAALENSGLTPEQIQQIMDINAGTSSDSGQQGGGQQGGEQTSSDLVIPGIGGGNIVDGTYYDPTQNLPLGGGVLTPGYRIPRNPIDPSTLNRPPSREETTSGVINSSEPRDQVNGPWVDVKGEPNYIEGEDWRNHPDRGADGAPLTPTQLEAIEKVKAKMEENGFDPEKVLEDPEAFLGQLKLDLSLGNISLDAFNSMTNMLQGAMGLNFSMGIYNPPATFSEITAL